MKKILFCMYLLALAWAGVCIGVEVSTDMGAIALFPLFISGLLMVSMGFLAFVLARSIGEDRARGKYKMQRELQSGIYTVERGDKRFVILARNISMPGEGEELYRLDKTIGDDVFAVKATREGDSVSIEPYRGNSEVVPV